MKELYVNYTANVITVNTLLPHFQELGVGLFPCSLSPSRSLFRRAGATRPS